MIIADTGFFLALGNESDLYHQQAKDLLQTLNEPLIATYPVISETSYLIEKRIGIDAQSRFLRQFVQGYILIFQLEIHHLERMIELMQKYADLPMDLADASLVVTAEHLGHGRILTVDRRDFQIYRWQNQRPFENLFF